MIRDFEQWNATIGELSELRELAGTRVGVEAADYINTRILNHPRAKEPLVPALGGLPLALEQHVEADLRMWKQLDIEPKFIFSGLDITPKDEPFRHKQDEATVNANAWNLYDNHQAEASVAKFGESSYVTPEDLFPALQDILTKHDLKFMVAPYSAWAELAYMEKIGHCNAISGSSDLLLFECDKFITSWNFEEGHFLWTKRSKCISDLERFANNGPVSEEIFVDALLLAGSPFLPTLPNLMSPNRTDLLKPHGAIKMIMAAAKTGYSVVINNQDDPRMKSLDYVQRYRAARLAVKNHPIYTIDGKIEPLHLNDLPSNAVEYLRSRYPDELYHYLSQGLINSRVLQWRSCQNIYDVPPMDGGESAEYKALVSSKLTPIRATTIALLSSTLHNWFRHKDVEQRSWFADSAAEARKLNVIGTTEFNGVESWNVKEDIFAKAVTKYKEFGILGSAILALQDSEFVAKSSLPKEKEKEKDKHITFPTLSTEDEILYNSIWRFLALREYVDAKHELTAWGKVLVTAVAGTKGHTDLVEGTLIAIELLRLGSLNADIGMFPTYNGAPMRGTSKDQQSNMLISRVAGLGTLHHRPIGFTGPLSQHLLGYNSIITLVRQTLRDLLEVAATHMFLTGRCDRLAANYPVIASKLPLRLPTNCALSIAVKSYLDELLSNDADPTSSKTKAMVLNTASTRYFPQSIDFAGDLAHAFELWDAIYDGVKNGGSAIPESTRKLWTDTNEWLAARR